MSKKNVNMKNKAIFYPLLLIIAVACGSIHPAPPSGTHLGIALGVLADRSSSLSGHTLLDTTHLARLAELLVLSGREATIYFEVAGNTNFLAPVQLNLPGLPPPVADPTLFEVGDSVLRLNAYRTDIAGPAVRQFLTDCQARLETCSNQQWTDLKSSTDKLSVLLNLPRHEGWQKFLFEQTDGLHHLPHHTPQTYCPEWPTSVEVFTACRGPVHRCPEARELGSAGQFYHQLSKLLK